MLAAPSDARKQDAYKVTVLRLTNILVVSNKSVVCPSNQGPSKWIELIMLGVIDKVGVNFRKRSTFIFQHSPPSYIYTLSSVDMEHMDTACHCQNGDHWVPSSSWGRVSSLRVPNKMNRAGVGQVKVRLLGRLHKGRFSPFSQAVLTCTFRLPETEVPQKLLTQNFLHNHSKI